MSDVTLDTGSVAYRRRTVTSIMLHVIAALIPGIALYALLLDHRILFNLLIACGTALLFECLFVWLRRRAVLPTLKDASVVLAAILLVLSVPQSLPIWQLIFGVFIMCALGKHVFGGLGHNPFNPAMVAYAVLIVSFPLTMTQWTTELGFLDVDHNTIVKADNELHAKAPLNAWDGVSGATPLDRLDAMQREYTREFKSSPGVTDVPDEEGAQVDNNTPFPTTPDTGTIINDETSHQAAQLILQSDWLWISCAWLAGGLYLLFMRVISWRIPVALLTSVWVLYLLYGLGSSGPVLPASVALFSGAIMLGAFFIATDPVSAATSDPGKLVYATGIGMLCFVIREFSAYPEGIAFAVLLMNMCVPLIDYAFTRNRLDSPAINLPHDKGPAP